jgi:hypothetical protein
MNIVLIFIVPKYLNFVLLSNDSLAVFMSWGAGIPQPVQWLCCGLDDQGIGAQFPSGARDFSLLHSVESSSCTQPASYPIHNSVLSPGIKWSGRKARDSLPSAAEVKNGWRYTSTHAYIFLMQQMFALQFKIVWNSSVIPTSDVVE